MSQDRRLVYSTDPRENAKCPRCRLLLMDCECRSEEAVGKFTVIFRLEKSGRGGKTVTVMEGFPKNESFLKDLTKEMKSKCGVGGTHLIGEKSGVIEIQGDKRDALKALLTKKGLPFKGM